jgi:Glycosyltransferase Family 4
VGGALLANGLTERGHDVTLFAAPGSDTKARWSRRSTRSRPATPSGDPWYEASHVVSVYEHGEEFDVLHGHSGPVGVSVGALSDSPTIHTLHGPFTQQAHMLYSRVARQHWFVAISESQRSMAPKNLR